VGLAIIIPSISAQDAALDVAEDDPIRTAELTLVLGDDTTPLISGTEPSIWVVVRMILVLALVALAIYGVVFILKRASKPAAASDPFLKVLANTHLGSNRYVHVVSVGTKAWLVGSSEGCVNVLGEVDDKDIINAMLLEDSRKAVEAPGRLPDFLAVLRRFGTNANAGSPGADEIRRRRERLREM